MTTSPEHENNKAELHLPVEYKEFIISHPSVLDIQQRVYDTLDTRFSYTFERAAQPNYDEWPKQSDIDGYLGAGYEKSAYVMDDEYVVKIQNKIGDSSREFVVDPSIQVSDLVRGVGVEGLEQLVTANPENGVLVTKLAKGRPLPEIPSSELLGKISKDHLAKLEKTLKYMADNLLEFDNPQNVLFDPEEGFTFIDYRTPLGLDANRKYSTNIDDENYSSIYADFIDKHSLSSALNILLSSRKKLLKGLPNATGELKHYLKPTLGRRVVKSLVKFKI